MTTKQDILNLLNTSDKAIARALVVLNERQTQTEKSSEQTINDNGVGFTPADARMGTSMAGYYTRNKVLTPKQIAYWRKPNVRGVPRINKYAGQLLEIAKAKAAVAIQKMETPQPVIKMDVASLGDVGNLCEEQIAIEEQLLAYQEGAYGSGPNVQVAIDHLYDRLHSIKEQLEEINRCEYKMQRDLML